MVWDKILGQEKIKQKLKESVTENRISHAQLFVGENGWGALLLAVAYAGEILASEKGSGVWSKVDSFQHPDIHFSFPVSSNDSVKKDPTSNQFIKEWREFLLENPYGNLYDWLEFIGAEKKQALINVHESQEIVKSLSLNSYEGSYKFMIIWLPEFMNTSAANKLLKILEEPPNKTVFILVSEREDLLLPTIISRCQVLQLNRLTNDDIVHYLKEEKGISLADANRIAVSSEGNLHAAIQAIHSEVSEFEHYFVQWVRHAFLAGKTPSALKQLVGWSSDISNWTRERQKQFLAYCSEIFRQALLKNYGAEELVYMPIATDGFKLQNFAPFIHGANIQEILNEINESSFHIERNANSKIVLLDLSIKLTRFLHKKN